MEEHDDDGRAPARRKFLAGATAAGVAAGAAVLGTADRAAAAIPATAEHSLALKWLDLSGTPWLLDDVTLGTGGFALGTFSAMGDMAALAVRIKVGAGASLGSGPWCLDASELPTGFKPVTPPNDLSPTGTPGWGGMGQIADFTDLNHNSYVIGMSMGNFTNVGAGTLVVWSLPDRHNTGSGAVMVNYGGVVPFGREPAEGTTLFSNLVYQRDTSED